MKKIVLLFAFVLSVSTGYAQKEKINWRSFTDQSGSISEEWSYPATPTFYLLDAKGTIRKKWIGHPGEKTIDKALDRLLKELKTRRRPDSR